MRSGTAERESIRYSPGYGGSWRLIEHHMLIIVGPVAILIALAIISRIRASGGVNTLGWMSEQWLAEYRASNSH